ncbi:hypothetical protein F0562_015720 [Nyssa sinensis]|uniref:Uncharacterized protein n=1 Tax=Nyssa sinensis TaxID=561372 RepID=A0A5J4ZME7_9ASTE|nr:hypothetical protein F0562_015720 [Nyssa sinensis]
MEELVLPQSQKQNLHTSVRKFLPSGSQKGLWLLVREGSLADVDLALALLKKNGGNINSRNMFGLTPLHIATWRNHIPIIRRLLAAGADPNARDGESGWSSLHRALHFGHLAVASILLQSGASSTLEDFKSRTPVDLLSGPVLQAVGSGDSNSVATESLLVEKSTLGVLEGGGRLGHPDFDIHSGQAAVITPRRVTSGLGARRVRAIAAAKHHTVVATEGGEVFTWGSNREGQLGYTSVDTQPTPRRVTSLRPKIVAVAAANKHTAVVSESGEVFTWGCNREGQLGYGTSNSASNYTPRVVECLKGKVFIGVAAAKYHTIVLGADGEVFTWGHRLVTPRRVVISRNIKKSGSIPLKFHRKERLHVVSVAAGMIHSMALTYDGALFYWVSSDPGLRCQQLYSLSGRAIVSVSAGKYWTAAVTATGDVYMWDGKKGKDEPPIATRLLGVKRATSVSVGETHLLIIGSLYHPVYPPNIVSDTQKLKLEVKDDLNELCEDFMFNDIESDKILPSERPDDVGNRPIPSLKSLCEKVAAECLVEPRNVIQLLEIADTLGADDLRKHCEDIAIRNLDYILTVSAHAIASASLDVLANLEKMLDLRSSEYWSYRRLPTPTATFPAIINSEEEDSESEIIRSRNNHTKKHTSKKERDLRLDCFLQLNDDVNQAICKQVRALGKKLQQIEMLEDKQAKGHLLDDQQIAKLQTRPALENSLAELGVPIETMNSKSSSSVFSDGKGSKKAEESRKQRRKSKQKAAQGESESGTCGIGLVQNPVKGFLDVEISEVKHREDNTNFEATLANQGTNESPFCTKKEPAGAQGSRSSLPAASKKKKKKGGLSMFLSGALDDIPKDAVTPPTPKSEGPAWGGARISKGPTSLRQIQDEQGKIKENLPTRSKDQVEDLSVGRSGAKIQLSSFLPSKPIPVVSAQTSQGSDGERSTPPWAASGTPPLLSHPSLRDIQMQQVKQHNLSQSPKTRTTGFSVATATVLAVVWTVHRPCFTVSLITFVHDLENGGLE